MNMPSGDSRNHIIQLLQVGFIWLLVLFAGTATAAGLTEAETHGYQQWLHSLQQTINARQETGNPELTYLFPFSRIMTARGRTTADHHVSIGRALNELEAADNPRQQYAQTAFSALAMARNYSNLCEFDSALVWYDLASQLDENGIHTREIRAESLANAVVVADSLRVVRHLLNILGSNDCREWEAELVLAYRYLLVHDAEPDLDLLVRKIASSTDQIGPELRYWHAFALATCKQWPEALANLRVLVAGGGMSHGLTEAQRAWVLIAVPDLLYLTDDVAAATQLYQQLVSCQLPDVRAWSEYQLANLNFLAARYTLAWSAFIRLCEGEDLPAWQERACEMADLADQMKRLRAEGKPYGTAAFFRP
ncbi:MAG: hypothetical protein ABIF77_14880 [bacterium]